jgi:Uma2 family endonuclease
MSTATLQKPRAKAKVKPPVGIDERTHDHAQREAFYMPTGSMTLAEFRKWTYSDDFPKTGLIAFIGNEIFIDMSPERLTSHGSVKTAVGGTIIPLVQKKNKGKLYFDRARVVNEVAEISNEPDAVFATWESFKNGTIRLIPTADDEDYIELEGTPDWILEIVSPSSVSKDKRKLRLKYHKAGIGEYWLIDARGDDVDFKILIHGEDDYEPARNVGNWQVSPTFGKRFCLRRITDEIGGIDYRLDMK